MLIVQKVTTPTQPPSVRVHHEKLGITMLNFAHEVVTCAKKVPLTTPLVRQTAFLALLDTIKTRRVHQFVQRAMQANTWISSVVPSAFRVEKGSIRTVMHTQSVLSVLQDFMRQPQGLQRV
mgnify:CR=1 FL=1